MKKIIILSVIVGSILLTGPFITRAVAYFFVGDNGFIGIRTSDPQAPLDVSGAMYSRLVVATSSTIDWSKGNVQSMTLYSNPSLSFVNAQAGGQYTLLLSQDSTGGRTVTWPSSVRWAGKFAPALTSDAGGADMTRFVYDGSSYLGTYDRDFAAVSTTSLVNSLITYWKLDETSGNAADSVGSNELADHNSAGYASGKINNGASLAAASGDYFSTDSSTGFPSGSAARSVSLWFKLSSLPGSQTNYTFFNYGDDTDHHVFGLSLNGGSGLNRSLNLFGYSDDMTYSVENIQTGTWYHYVATFDGTVAKIYLNGSNVASADKSSWNTTSGTPAYIGNFLGSGYNMDGAIDEVAVWSRALTANEIAVLYNNGSGRQYPF